ncbi:trypsin-like peptidase domain-containing protein [Vibrio cholerae]|nr:trypsin-like peptidase domain-containing protein [Vibrio cholerae]EGR0510679.1 trypsin-like peptidase domain-containing protein [Vibrio cholerae]
MKTIDLHSLSFKSMYIRLMFNDMQLASGTAFLSGLDDGRYMLFTNKHNVTGKYIGKEGAEALLDPETAAIPNKLVLRTQLIVETDGEGFGSKGYVEHILPLYEDMDAFLDPLWTEHDDPEVDVVGLMYTPKDIDISRLILSCKEDWFECGIGEQVNVIGYPFGVSTDSFPVWATGYIASEPSINVDDKPLFYIDSRTRKGQSGSPVVHRIKVGDVVSYQGQQYAAKKEQYHMLGIYSGRINEESDIGKVWKTVALRDILEKKSKEFEAARTQNT